MRGLCCACRRASWCRGSPVRMSQGKPGVPPTVLDPLSDSESEPNDEPCEADRVAYQIAGGTALLATTRCRDAAAAIYDAQAPRRKCAKGHCFKEGRSDKDGFRLCAIHAAEWSRPATPTSTPRRRTAPNIHPRFGAESGAGTDAEPAKSTEKRGDQWIA